MPGTAEAVQLTDRYRAAQLARRGRTVAQLSAVWAQVVGADDVDGGIAAWSRYVGPTIAATQAAAAEESLAYLAAYVATELGEQRLERADVDTSAHARAEATSGRPIDEALRRTLPVIVKGRIAQGQTPERALEVGLARANRATGSLVSDAGRDALLEGIDDDERCVGYSRVTRSKSCPFCRMLAENGAVYSRKADAGSYRGRYGFTQQGVAASFRAHPLCGCSAEPAVRGVRERYRRRPPAQPRDERTGAEVPEVHRVGGVDRTVDKLDERAVSMPSGRAGTLLARDSGGMVLVRLASGDAVWYPPDSWGL